MRRADWASHSWLVSMYGMALCCVLPVQVFKTDEAFTCPPDTLRERTGSSCRVLDDCC